MEEIAVEFVYSRQREIKPFYLKDDYVKIWEEVIFLLLVCSSERSSNYTKQ